MTWNPGERSADGIYGSMNGAGFALHIIHQEILTQIVGRGEVGFALAHLGDFLHELDEAVVRGEHKSVDHNAGALALVYFFQSFADDKGVQAKSVFVDAAVFEGKGRGLAVGDHDDLPHVFALAEENALGHAEAFAGVGVVRAYLHASKFAQGNFFRRIVKEDQAEGVARILRADEMRESHGDTLRGREAIFAVENHAVAAIEKNNGGTGGLIFALVNHQVAVLHFDGNLGAFAADGIGKGLADVEIQGVAEFVGAGDATRFDAGREGAGVMAAEAAAS